MVVVVLRVLRRGISEVAFELDRQANTCVFLVFVCRGVGRFTHRLYRADPVSRCETILCDFGQGVPIVCVRSISQQVPNQIN